MASGKTFEPPQNPFSISATSPLLSLHKPKTHKLSQRKEWQNHKGESRKKENKKEGGSRRNTRLRKEKFSSFRSLSSPASQLIKLETSINKHWSLEPHILGERERSSACTSHDRRSRRNQLCQQLSSSVYSSLAPQLLCVAELGCSSGPNTLYMAAELLKTVRKLSRSHGLELPEFQILLNDLPGNDFNSIFQYLLSRFRAQINEESESNSGNCYVYGVPGSFYGRLFAAKSLHFVHSSYSLMWLSKIPEAVKMWNKENIYIGSKSPVKVINAYYSQFRKDFNTFLKCRSEEVVGGGGMVLTILGRKSEDAASKECCYIWELLALSLKELVSEGVIEEEALHLFNIPQYTPSPAEVKKEVEEEGSFAIRRLVASETQWASCGGDGHGYNVAKCMRSVAEPLLVEHFGESIIEQLFEKYQRILTDQMSKEETKFVNVTISVTRRE